MVQSSMFLSLFGNRWTDDMAVVIAIERLLDAITTTHNQIALF